MKWKCNNNSDNRQNNLNLCWNIFVLIRKIGVSYANIEWASNALKNIYFLIELITFLKETKLRIIQHLDFIFMHSKI